MVHLGLRWLVPCDASRLRPEPPLPLCGRVWRQGARLLAAGWRAALTGARAVLGVGRLLLRRLSANAGLWYQLLGCGLSAERGLRCLPGLWAVWVQCEDQA